MCILETADIFGGLYLIVDGTSYTYGEHKRPFVAYSLTEIHYIVELITFSTFYNITCSMSLLPTISRTTRFANT